MEVIMWDSDFPYSHLNPSLNTSSVFAYLLHGYILLNDIFARGKLGI